MSWVTVIWSMIASACFTLAGTHLLLWLRDRKAQANLIFMITAASAGATSAFELGLMLSQTTAQFAHLMRWTQIPIALLVLSLVALVHVHFKTGRSWLAWTVVGLRLLASILNFFSPVSIQYWAITALRPMHFLGDTVSIAVTVPNPWILVAQLSNILLIVYFADATITLIRRGAKRQALVAGVITVFGMLPVLQSILVVWGLVQLPFIIAGYYLAIAVAMSFELSADVMLAGRLIRKVSDQEGQLRDSERRMDLAANAADIGMWVWDIARQDFWMNDKGRMLFGFNASEKLKIERILDVIHPEDRDSVRLATQGYLARGGDYEAEYRIVRNDGSVRWFSGRRRVEMGTDKKPVRMIGISLDVTPQRQAELEIHQQRRELAHLARVTTLGELSGSLAHELNQPLTAILSNAQAAHRFLKSGNADTEEVGVILEDIITQNRRAGDVIHRLRLLFKKTDMLENSIGLNDVVQDVAKLMRGDLLDHQMKLEMALEPEPLMIFGDSVQLQQVVLNLMINACDAMKDCLPKDRKLFVRTNRDQSGAMTVSVTDLGCGIPAESREKIFESFFTTKENGMGLGLSVCRTILDAHKGKLWMTTNHDRGTTFHFSIPAEQKGGK